MKQRRPATLEACSIARVMLKAGLLLLILALVGACEAPLDLERLKTQESNPIRRSDLFQAVTVQGMNVVIVGRDSALLTSHDQARTWQRHEFPGFPSFIDITSCPNGEFVALDTEAGVWVSTDQGDDWRRHPIKTDETVQAITCGSDNRLWVVGSFTTILQSGDLGETWSSRSFDVDAILNGIQFFDDKQGIVVGEFGTFMTTSDGGKNWSRDLSIPNEFYPQDMYFVDPRHGWVVGLGGTVLYTRDGGHTWESQDTATKVSLYGIAMVGKEAFIIGREGVLLKRQGARWQKLTYGNPARLFLRAISSLGDGRLIVGGQAGALMLIDTRHGTSIRSSNTDTGA